MPLTRWLAVLLLGGGVVQASPAPVWIDAQTHAQAARIVSGGLDARSLLGDGDTALAQWPQLPGADGLPPADATAPAPHADSPPAADLQCGDVTPYRIARTVPSRTGGSSWWTRNPAPSSGSPAVLVQFVGTARLAARHPGATQALVDIRQATDAVRPGDLLLPLDSSAEAPDIARPAPSACIPS